MQNNMEILTQNTVSMSHNSEDRVSFELLMNEAEAVSGLRPEDLADAICILGKAEQPAILEAQLKAGVPIVYHDETGDLVQKNPDGTITLLKKKEELH